MSDVLRVAAAARVFTLAVVAATALVGDVSVAGLWYAAVIATAAQAIAMRRSVPDHLVLLVEGGLTAAVAVWSFPEHQAALPYLAVPALIGGIAGGVRYVGGVLVTEAALLALAAWLLVGRYDADLAGSGVTWLTTGLGLGLLGTFTRRNVTTTPADASYRSALGLIRQLHSLSGKLTSGLDPADLADQAMAVVAEEIVVRQAVVMLHQGTDFTPLRYSTGTMGFPLESSMDLVERCWQTQQPAYGESVVALPLSTGSERVAVILAECPTLPDAASTARLLTRLESPAVQLSAALLFSSVHESATAEERRRLAREVHDGVAQDVASLGYLVDNLAGSTTDPAQAADVALLRKEVSRVVTELRNSVFDLRNETAAGQGLGQSIALFARHVGSHSPLTVHVTLDESSVRLRPLVEAELLRITQEAINNARRHSDGSNLWVTCRVHPPYAEIEVTDDGAGLQAPRDDSHGLRIMHERAERAGAVLLVESPAAHGRGTRVRITLT